MMDHRQERWECIRDFVIFDGVIRCGSEDISDMVDSNRILFPTCDEYLLPLSRRQVEQNTDIYFQSNFDLDIVEA